MRNATLPLRRRHVLASLKSAAIVWTFGAKTPIKSFYLKDLHRFSRGSIKQELSLVCKSFTPNSNPPGTRGGWHLRSDRQIPSKQMSTTSVAKILTHISLPLLYVCVCLCAWKNDRTIWSAQSILSIKFYNLYIFFINVYTIWSQSGRQWASLSGGGSSRWSGVQFMQGQTRTLTWS